ncbi:MAG TPA: SsrA-binding protein SmpB [bacterium]|nr:SsrA-binding protein SmpB [bacterium]
MSKKDLNFHKNFQIKNNKAHFEYQILDTWECGVLLLGMEAKSIRLGQIDLNNAYISVKNGKKPEVYLFNAHIPAYKKASPEQLADYDPTRSRKLLLHRSEINKIIGKMQEKGLTAIPLKVYNKGNQIKVEIALAKGKKLFEKKEYLKERDIKRDLSRQLKKRF